MSCSGCADLSAELSSQKAFFAQWFESLQEQLYSMDMKFEEAHQKSMEFRKEVFFKLDGLRSDVMMNVEKSGWSNNSAFLTHESAPLEEILERENVSDYPQSDDGFDDNTVPAADFSMADETEKVVSPTFFEHQEPSTIEHHLPRYSMFSRREIKKLPHMLRNKRIVRVIRVRHPKKKSARTTTPQTGTKKRISGSFYDAETRFVGCSLCDTSIVAGRKSNKWRHAMLHLDEKAFQCSECGSKFNRLSNGVRHAQTVHSGTESAKDLIVWALDKEEYQKNLAAKTAECFPIQTMSPLGQET